MQLIYLRCAVSKLYAQAFISAMKATTIKSVGDVPRYLSLKMWAKGEAKQASKHGQAVRAITALGISPSTEARAKMYKQLKKDGGLSGLLEQHHGLVSNRVNNITVFHGPFGTKVRMTVEQSDEFSKRLRTGRQIDARFEPSQDGKLLTLIKFLSIKG